MHGTMGKMAVLAGLCGFLACRRPVEIGLHYKIDIASTDVVRIETKVSVAAPDDRMFFADQPYRAVAQGIGYEVRDFTGEGHRALLITHDATIGFSPSPQFVFTLLPPIGPTPPQLNISAQVFGTDALLGKSEVVSAAFAAGAFVEVVVNDARCGGRTCTSDEVCCAGSCVTMGSDRAHCGGCDVACAATETCSGGICRCEGGSGCAAGSACCPGTGCLNLASDAFNCGACGNACNPGESCLAGQCVCPSNPGGAACSPGGLCCSTSGCTASGSCQCNNLPCATPNVCCNDTSCLDLANDHDNCGSCGNACASGLVCDHGQCKCGTSVCSASDVCCPGSGCKNTQNDPTNCGGCGIACGNGQVCSNATCECGTSGLSCDTQKPLCCASVSQCVNPANDHDNCGACGKSCKTLEVCTSSVCKCNGGAACGTGNRCCPDTGGCVDVASNQQNCGGCGIPCAGNETCVSGKCTPSTICNCLVGSMCCGGTCINIQTDVANCGGCGQACASGQLCCQGKCRDQDENNCGSCDNVCTLGAPKGWGSYCCLNCDPHPTGRCVSNTVSCLTCIGPPN